MASSVDDFLSGSENLEEENKNNSSKEKAKEETEQFEEGDYDKYQQRYIEIVLSNLKKEGQLRKKELRKLSRVATFWMIAIVIITLMQGFSSFPIHWFNDSFTYLKFNLSNEAYIALVTTTTTTILGLYSIAAYWLYRKDALTFDFLKKKEKDKEESDK